MSAELQSLNGEIVLHPDGKGIFDVTVDGELIFSKYMTHRFPEPGEITGLLKSHT